MEKIGNCHFRISPQSYTCHSRVYESGLWVSGRKEVGRGGLERVGDHHFSIFIVLHFVVKVAMEFGG